MRILLILTLQAQNPHGFVASVRRWPPSGSFAITQSVSPDTKHGSENGAEATLRPVWCPLWAQWAQTPHQTMWFTCMKLRRGLCPVARYQHPPHPCIRLPPSTRVSMWLGWVTWVLPGWNNNGNTSVGTLTWWECSLGPSLPKKPMTSGARSTLCVQGQGLLPSFQADLTPDPKGLCCRPPARWAASLPGSCRETGGPAGSDVPASPATQDCGASFRLLLQCSCCCTSSCYSLFSWVALN